MTNKIFYDNLTCGVFMKEHSHKPNFELSVDFIEKFLNKEIRPKHSDFNFIVHQNEDNDDVFISIIKEKEHKTIRLTNQAKDMNKFCYVSYNTKPSKIVKLIEDYIRKINNHRLADILDNIYGIVY